VEPRTTKGTQAALQWDLFPRLLAEYLRLENPEDRVTQTVNLLDRWGRFFDIKMVVSYLRTG